MSICRDHLGNRYRTVEDLCSAYNINTYHYKMRLRNGWSLERTLTTPMLEHKKCIDHLGNMYSSIGDMCSFYKIDRSSFDSRLSAGWSLEEALTMPIQTRGERNCKCCRDHLGLKYESVRDMCNAYNINHSTYQSRMRLGWSLEEALTTPINAQFRNISY